MIRFLSSIEIACRLRVGVVIVEEYERAKNNLLETNSDKTHEVRRKKINQTFAFSKISLSKL
jgi:hypothetical protein